MTSSQYEKNKTFLKLLLLCKLGIKLLGAIEKGARHLEPDAVRTVPGTPVPYGCTSQVSRNLNMTGRAKASSFRRTRTISTTRRARLLLKGWATSKM